MIATGIAHEVIVDLSILTWSSLITAVLQALIQAQAIDTTHPPVDDAEADKYELFRFPSGERVDHAELHDIVDKDCFVLQEPELYDEGCDESTATPQPETTLDIYSDAPDGATTAATTATPIVRPKQTKAMVIKETFAGAKIEMRHDHAARVEETAANSTSDSVPPDVTPPPRLDLHVGEDSGMIATPTTRERARSTVDSKMQARARAAARAEARTREMQELPIPEPGGVPDPSAPSPTPNRDTNAEPVTEGEERTHEVII